MTQTELAPEGASTSARRTRSVVLVSIGAVVILVLVAVAAYQAGTKHGNRVRALTGTAYVGAHQASVKVAGWSYGIRQDVTWIDQDGTSHEDGWPACLAPLGATVRVRFGEISVNGPLDDSWREVVWVDCRGATRVR